jgi:hypothetical protein
VVEVAELNTLERALADSDLLQQVEREHVAAPGILVLGGRVHPQTIAGQALETGADGIGCVFVDDEGEDG